MKANIVEIIKMVTKNVMKNLFEITQYQGITGKNIMKIKNVKQQ